jgi:Sec-independent protein translocase protein TatA
VFGMSFGELATLLLVAMIVLGPKELPRYARMAGHRAARARDWGRSLEDDPMLFAVTMAVLAAATAGLLGRAHP